VFQRVRVVTTVSRELAAWVQNGTGRHVAASHIHPMPIRSKNFPWSRGGGGAVVVARLTAQKRVHLAIDSVASLIASGHNLPLTIVGDGPERAALEQHARKLGIGEFVRFTGNVDSAAVPDYLARADVMIFPSRDEGFGLAAAEALMAGVPVVACWDGGGVLDIVPESGAGRLTIPSAAAVSEALLSILQDPDRRDIARLVGESWRARLAPDHVAEVCHRWYREALSA
jgi:glycosyltransferase involved in cell wall biosynthesis